MRSVMPMIADMQPARTRSFKKFRSLSGAVNWIQKHPENNGRLKLSDYTTISGNARDKWYIVNFQYAVRMVDVDEPFTNINNTI